MPRKVCKPQVQYEPVDDPHGNLDDVFNYLLDKLFDELQK